MIFEWIEQALTYKPDRVEHASLTPYGFRKVTIEHGRRYTTTVYLSLVEGAPLVLFSHGNTGNVSFHTFYYRLFQRLGVSFVAYDYPGYGESKGRPSEATLYESGLSVVDLLKVSGFAEPQKIIHFGLSLGAGVAVEVVHRVGARALILEAAFTDTRRMGRHMFPRLKLDRFVPNRFLNEEKISSLICPLLVLHGTNDQTTPISMGEALYAAHRGPKERLFVEGAGHADVGSVAGALYDDTIRTFIQGLP